MKEKSHTKSWYKKKAWKLFSEWVRRSHADSYGQVKCVTCLTKKHWKQMQAGHYVDRRNNSVLFDERLVFPQCYACNCLLKGNKIKYSKYMSDKFGYTLEQLNELDNLKFKTKKMAIYDYQELIDKYTDALVGLEIKNSC